MFYTKFHLPRPIFYSLSSKCTRIDDFPHCHKIILSLQWDFLYREDIFVLKLGPGIILSLTFLCLEPHIYVSVNQVSIGLDNGLVPIQCQAII